jgi:hypothetical protein
MESKFLWHKRCPRCEENGKDRGGNNLAVYSDHSYCFSCGYTQQRKYNGQGSTGPSSVSGHGKRVYDETRKNNPYCPNLPPDYILSLPSVGVKWLSQYGITDKEMAVNRIGWSDDGFTIGGRGNQDPIQYSPCMVFPIFNIQGTLLMWQARYFGMEKSYPKYITKGKPNEIIHVLGKGDRLVIVEDILSAIKVSRVTRSVPLWGSSPSLVFLNRLRVISDNLVIWLDPDKTVEAERLRRKVSLLFDEVSIVHSSSDPKAYGTKAIAQKIG